MHAGLALVCLFPRAIVVPRPEYYSSVTWPVGQKAGTFISSLILLPHLDQVPALGRVRCTRVPGTQTFGGRGHSVIC